MKLLSSHLIIIILVTIFVSVPCALLAQESITPDVAQEPITPEVVQGATTTETAQEAVAPEVVQEVLPLEVAVATICEAVIELEPIGTGVSFAASVGNLCCFTKIIGAQTPTQVVHVWYFGETERARVSLAVNAASWRTYSSKKIQVHEVGSWRVEVLDSEGSVLKVLQFTITPQAEAVSEEAKPEAVQEEIQLETIPGEVQPEQTPQ